LPDVAGGDRGALGDVGAADPDRVVLGMPGTPMPASTNLKPAEAADLIRFVLSLPEPGSEKRAEHRRTRVTARRCAGPRSSCGRGQPEQAPPLVGQLETTARELVRVVGGLSLETLHEMAPFPAP